MRLIISGVASVTPTRRARSSWQCRNYLLLPPFTWKGEKIRVQPNCLLPPFTWKIEKIRVQPNSVASFMFKCNKILFSISGVASFKLKCNQTCCLLSLKKVKRSECNQVQVQQNSVFISVAASFKFKCNQTEQCFLPGSNTPRGCTRKSQQE